MASLPAIVLLLFVSISAIGASTLRCPGNLLTNAVMSHPYDVTKYYKCHSSRYLIEMQCDPGMEFSSHRAICMKSANYGSVVQRNDEVTTPCPCPTTTECQTTTRCPTTTECPCPTTTTTTTPCPCPPETPCPTTTTTTTTTPCPCPPEPPCPTTTTTTTTTPCPETPTPTPDPPTTTTTRCPED